MSKKIKRPYTLVMGILLILLGIVDFTDSFQIEDLVKQPQLLFSIAGLLFILFAFAKS